MTKFRIIKLNNGKRKRVGKLYYKTRFAADLTINAYEWHYPYAQYTIEEF